MLPGEAGVDVMTNTRDMRTPGQAEDLEDTRRSPVVASMTLQAATASPTGDQGRTRRMMTKITTVEPELAETAVTPTS